MEVQSACHSEEQELTRALKATRKAVAEQRNIPPETLVSEFTVRDIARRRPGTMEQLAQVPGMSEAALAVFGEALLATVLEVCGGR